MANKKNTEPKEAEVKEEVTEAEVKDPNEEYVEIRLFKDSGKYNSDVFVAVNGENCIVQRGKPVKIKRKFANVIMQQLDEDEKTEAMISELTSKAADL